MSNRYREALAHLTYGVEDGGGFVLLTGEVGTGKTTVCRCLLQQLPDKTRLAFVLNPKLNSLELLATICDELKIDYPENSNSLKLLTDKLSEYLLECYNKDLSVVVMIDEAQNIDSEVLEQIRLLTNLETNQKKLLQIILVGQPELQEKLAKRELRQLAQRITARYHLRPLNLKETMAYVLHRVRIAGGKKSLFSRKSIEQLHNKTAGIPRLINTICDRALVAASSRNKIQVDHKIMQEAITDVMEGQKHSDTLVNKPHIGYPKFALLASVVVAVFVAAFWLGQQSKQPQINETKPQSSQQVNQSSQILSKQAVDSPNLLVLESDEIESSPVTRRSQATLVDHLLGNERWDNNGYWSMQQLLSLWQIDYSPLSDGPSCPFAKGFGLLCETSIGNWQQLRQLNRPAVLKFSAGLQGEFWGTVQSLSGLEAKLKFGEREVSVGLDELSTIWTGEFKLVWQAPQGYQGELKLGDRGDSVNWLSDQMRILGADQLSTSSVFDQSLKLAVSEFQRQRSITADGIAGMHTILMINRETLDGIPMLQE
ncbi:MAG: AAA family ATPase [Kangiellaceae bacterium]|nr:AAA family ATPase [Kangiellaceae bacterium]